MLFPCKGCRLYWSAVLGRPSPSICVQCATAATAQSFAAPHGMYCEPSAVTCPHAVWGTRGVSWGTLALFHELCISCFWGIARFSGGWITVRPDLRGKCNMDIDRKTVSINQGHAQLLKPFHTLLQKCSQIKWKCSAFTVEFL